MEMKNFAMKKDDGIIACADYGYKDDVVLNVSNRPDLGDYQYNGSFSLAKILKRSPILIADEIVEKLK